MSVCNFCASDMFEITSKSVITAKNDFFESIGSPFPESHNALQTLSILKTSQRRARSLLESMKLPQQISHHSGRKTDPKPSRISTGGCHRGAGEFWLSDRCSLIQSLACCWAAATWARVILEARTETRYLLASSPPAWAKTDQ